MFKIFIDKLIILLCEAFLISNELLENILQLLFITTRGFSAKILINEENPFLILFLFIFLYSVIKVLNFTSLKAFKILL